MSEFRISDSQIADILTKREALINELNSGPGRERQVALAKELSALEEAAKTAERLAGARQELADLESLAASDDKDLRAMAQDDLARVHKELPELEHAFMLLLLPRDEVDERGVILELRAGTGGDEAALFAGDLPRSSAGSSKSCRQANPILVGTRKSSRKFPARAFTHALSSKPAHTACNAFRKPKAADVFTLPPRRSPCFQRRRRSMSKSMNRT